MLSVIAQRYEVIQPLGQGSGGTCFLVRDREGQGLLALKAVSVPEASPEIIAAFHQECSFLQALHHPHLARLFDFGRDGPLLFYTSEYVEGSDFATAARERDWNAVFSLIVQGSWALQHLHTRGILHRDLKPANILAGKVHIPGEPDRQNRLVLKVIDFGLAISNAQATAASAPKGTLAYCAPEVLAKRPYDHRSDLYAWGVVLYEMALGRLPFASAKNFAQYLDLLTRQEVDLSPLVKSGETPEGILEILRGLLVRDPRNRLSSAREIIRILNETEGERFPLEAVSLDQLPQILEPFREPANEAFDIPLSHEPEAILAELLHRIRSGQRSEAWQWAERHWSFMETSSQPHSLERFLGGALHILIEQGDFVRARRTLEEANAHPLLRSPPSTELKIVEIQLTYREGRLEAADALYRNAAESWRSQASPEQQTRLENYAGLIAQSLKRYLDAARHFETGAELSTQTGRRDHALSLSINAATLYQDQGLWKKAYELFRRAETLARELNHVAHLATTLNNLGNLYLYFGRLNDAEICFSESLRLAQSQGIKPLAAYNLYLLTVSEEAKGNWERVEDCLKRALDYARELGETQPILQATLAEGYLHLGRGKFSECEATLHHVRKAAGEQAPTYGLQANWLEAKLQIQKGEISGGLLETWLKQVEADAAARGAKNNLWQIAADWGDYFSLRKENAKAREAYGRSLQILEELSREIPKEFQKSFFRDRKKERVRKALEKIEEPPGAKPITASQPSLAIDVPGASAPGEEVHMTISETPKEKVQTPSIDFHQWAAINRRLLLQQRIEPLLEEILDGAIQLTDAERGFLILSEAQDLDIRAARNFDRETLNKEEERISQSIAREVMRTGQTTVIFDAQTEDRFAQAQSVHALSLRSVLCVPLRSGSHPIGLVYLDNRYRQGVFQPRHLPLIEALADQASLALEHAQLHRENREKIEELKRSKELIEKLNARLEQDLNEKTVDLQAMRENLKRQNEEIRLRYTYDKILGESPKLKAVLKILDKVVDSQANVFIFGESGTGKELIAQAIHYNGSRREHPFVSENCSAIPENLLESELFGHVKGAFTGAERDKLGLFQLAHRGTLFLDEVGDMPLAMQAKLLRVLQEGEVRPVGGKDYRKVDVRVLAASHKDIKEMVARGSFRQDLYYRLNVLRIDLPPLRERREDIPLLIEHFLEQAAEAEGKKKPRLTKEALRLYMDYSWPGNIRELQNEVQRLLVLGFEKITPDLVSPAILQAAQAESRAQFQGGLDERVAEVEKRAIGEAMERYRGNKVKAAKALKIGRRTLYAKLELYRIPTEFGKRE